MENLSFRNGVNTNYSRISNVAGNEIRKNNARAGTIKSQEMEVETVELPPLEVEESAGDREGIFTTRSFLMQPSALLDEASREAQVRQSAEIHIAMRKRSDLPVNSNEAPIMVFGPAIGPYHHLKRGDGSGIQSISTEEIESYADTDQDILIGVEYKRTNGSTVTLKYMAKSKPMATLAKKLATKCKELAMAKPAWETYKLGQSRMLHLTNSCDATFSSEHCIISGLKAEYFKSDFSVDALIAKIRKAVRGKIQSAVPSEAWLNDIKFKRKRHLKLSCMGWNFGAAKDREKVFILVKLENPIEVGISMLGGRRCYERVNVSYMQHEEGGEWFSRQFVSANEANFLINVERRVMVGETSVNVIMGGVRGLPRITELDECVLRVTKNKYESQFQGDIGVFMMTLSHEWPKESLELKDEPFLVICQLGAYSGGDLLGKSFHPYERGATTLRQAVGSMDVQLFLKPEMVLNKPFRSSTNSWMLEVECPSASEMSSVLDCLDDNEAKKAFAVIRMDGDRANNECEKWCVLLDSRAHINGETRVDGKSSVREKAMTSPSKRRLRAAGKSLSKWDDEGNLRILDRQEYTRGESRDRDRSASNSRGRSSGGKTGQNLIQQGSAAKANHPDYPNVPAYYKMDFPKKLAPLSLTASPGTSSQSISSGTTSSLSSLSTISSLSSASARSKGQNETKPKEEIELCKQFALGTCIRGPLCNYRHEPKEIKLTNPPNCR